MMIVAITAVVMILTAMMEDIMINSLQNICQWMITPLVIIMDKGIIKGAPCLHHHHLQSCHHLLHDLQGEQMPMKTSYLFVETFTLEGTVLEQAHADLFIPNLTYR